MRKEYVVNVGNIGNINRINKVEAMKTYRMYIRDSKAMVGRGAQEDVYLMVDGEIEQEFNWYDWRISRQEAVVIKLEKELLKAKTILDRLQERQEEITLDAN